MEAGIHRQDPVLRAMRTEWRRLDPAGLYSHRGHAVGLKGRPDMNLQSSSSDIETPSGSASTEARLDMLPEVLTVEQVSAYLQVSRSVVYGEIREGRLPSVKLGMRVIRVSKWALRRWLEKDATQPTDYSEHPVYSPRSTARLH